MPNRGGGDLYVEVFDGSTHLPELCFDPSKFTRAFEVESENQQSWQDVVVDSSKPLLNRGRVICAGIELGDHNDAGELMLWGQRMKPLNVGWVRFPSEGF